MHYPPHLIIFLAVCNYLTEEQIQLIKNDLAGSPRRTHRQFLSIINRHFDFETFLKHPFIWQDVWIYNHIMYDKGKSWDRKKGLLAKYEQEVLLPQKQTLEAVKLTLASF